MIKNKLSKAELLFLLINALLLIFFAGFVYFKTRGLGDEGWLSYPYIGAFLTLGFGLVIWNTGFSRIWNTGFSRSDRQIHLAEREGEHKFGIEADAHRLKPVVRPAEAGVPKRDAKLGYFMVIILYLALLFAYDFSVAEAWIDAKGDVETAQVLREQGLKHFLKTYHHQTAHEILYSEAGRQGTTKYSRLLPFYPLQLRLEELAEAWGGNLRIAISPSDSLVSAKSEFGNPSLVSAPSEFGSPVASLPNGTDKTLANNRRQHHPPSFFAILASWMSCSDSLLSIKIFAKFMLLLYLLSLCLLLRKLLKDKLLAMIGIVAIALMPALLLASQAPRNDLPLGIISALLAMLLLHIAQTDKLPWWKHLLLGLLCFLAIFSKFTALLIALPVLAIYFYRYKLRAIPYLLLVALPVILIPILLYLITGYDMLLNIVTGRIVQDAWIAENTTAMGFVTQRVLFGQFRIGLPIMLLALFALPQVLKRKEYRPHFILFLFYIATLFLLWGSSIDRHQIGFLPFAIPMISLAFTHYRRLLKPILILLLLYNLLFIFYAVVDNGHDREHVLPLAQGVISHK